MIGKVIETQAGRLVVTIGEGDQLHRVVVDQRFYRNIDHGYATTVHKAQGGTVDRVKVLATLSLDRHLTYVAMTRHREDVALYYGRRSFGINGGLIKILSRKNAKETTFDYARRGLYRDALRFANSRGLHIVWVARTLVRDRLDWTLRQKRHLADIAEKLRRVGTRLGLLDLRHTTIANPIKEAAPMVAGINIFEKSVSDVVAEKVAGDPAMAKQWEEMSIRFRLVFAAPETEFKAMNFEAMLRDQATQKPARSSRHRTRLDRSAQGQDRPARRKGGQGTTRIAEINAPVLKRDIERYLTMRASAVERIEVEEQAVRSRLAIDIPALSPPAHRILEKVRDAIDRNDLPSALGFALADRMVKAEIDTFTRAVSERFGERFLLTNAAKDTTGSPFEKAATGMNPAHREQLVAPPGRPCASHSSLPPASGRPKR
ncbi:UvrD-like helicase C-terminal domain-containing protein [Mesorhizobium albiziae]|uniref:UvrD-like helicase C-terminal domain-containing protein n=2 Tax=Neomesorhizobium albiziae TaxID=335020 RepID=A0A1I4FZ01_9HYPH|nr:UvrD-like helicase C-terminal domain-containing protein [Mesorhizobium albiziae]